MSDIREHLDTSYEEYAKYLQNKYGVPKQPYYTLKEGTLVRNKISRAKEGLQCHHIREDIAECLSSPNKALNQDMSYQSPENLCYCNLLEHLLLHIKIAENLRNDSSDSLLRDVGIDWLVLAINSILVSPEGSWYSRKGAEKVLNEAGEAVEEFEAETTGGVNYNVNNLITDNIEDYKVLINRYCTSAFVRLRLDKTNKEIAYHLSRLFCKDTTQVQAIKDLIVEAASGSGATYLFDWNVAAYAQMEEAFREGKRTALINICTGGGKTTTSKEYLRVHHCRGLVLAPSNIIKEAWDKDDSVDATTYQTFMNDYTTRDYSKYGVIIADEAHHIEAERWGEGLGYVLENTSLPIIGLTATPSPAQMNGTDKYFQGNICEGLDLAKGIAENNIHPFGYIQSIYKLEEMKGEFDKAGEIGKELYNRLNLELNKNPIEKILRDNMPEGPRKIICFAQCVKDLAYAEQAMRRYNPNLEIYCIYSGKDKKADLATGYSNEEAKRIFSEATGRDICLINVGMATEGAHYEGVNTLVMFRRTRSNTLYMQQLGRIVVPIHKSNPQGLVFDFTNNAESLIHRKDPAWAVKTSTASSEKLKQLLDTLKKMQEEREGKELIYKDYTEDCVAILSALKESREVDSFERNLSLDLIAETETGDLSEIFDSSLYSKPARKKVKTGTNKESKRKAGVDREKSFSALPAAANKEATTLLVPTTLSSAETKKSAALALKEIVKWCYMHKVIEFEDTAKCSLIVNKEELFEKACLNRGFNKVQAIRNVIQNKTKSFYIMVSDISL